MHISVHTIVGALHCNKKEVGEWKGGKQRERNNDLELAQDAVVAPK